MLSDIGYDNFQNLKANTIWKIGHLKVIFHTVFAFNFGKLSCPVTEGAWCDAR